MIGLAQQLEEGLLHERVEPLTKATSQKLRKDFLVLVGNIKRVKNYDDAEKLRAGVRSWREFLYDWAAQIRADLESRKRMQPPVPESAVKSLVKALDPVWALCSELMSFPLEIYRSGEQHGKSKEALFADYQREIAKWDARARKKATEAWKAMDAVVLYAGNVGYGGEAVKLSTKDVENIELEGFRVRLVGFEDENERGEMQAALVRGLSMYRDRARKVFPLLLKKQLPLVIKANSDGSNAAASYNHAGFIEVNPMGHATGRDLREFTKIMAHEMSHHIYQTYLSGEARQAWLDFIHGGTVPLDLRDALASMKKHGDDLEKQDPVLALQIQGLGNDPAYKDLRLYSAKRIEDYLADGGDPIVRVNRSPITGYGAKNPEEAFCDAIGLLVGYGPRTVLPDVVGFIRNLVPELRVEMTHRTDGMLSALLENALDEGRVNPSRWFVKDDDINGGTGYRPKKASLRERFTVVRAPGNRWAVDDLKKNDSAAFRSLDEVAAWIEEVSGEKLD